MVETLIVVAIIVVLAGVVILSVINYLRSTTKLEYDGYAKSIFVAAQNHLTMAEHEGYLGRTEFGYQSSNDRTEGVYYFEVINGSCSFAKDKAILDLMLPYGAVDETVRAGSYIIRYQKQSAKVLDVFYWSESGRYSYNYQQSTSSVSSSDYNGFLSNKNDKDTLRNYSTSNAVIGYYGGEGADDLMGDKLEAPQIQVVNAERLYVMVNKPNSDVANAQLKLVIRGKESKNYREIVLSSASGADYLVESGDQYKVVLDDVTDSRKHFSNQFCLGTDPLIPGEDITVYAVAYNDQAFTNVAYSSEQITNSLFADSVAEVADGVTANVGIANIRHLENLDYEISGYDGSSAEGARVIAQTMDLNWNDFATAVATVMVPADRVKVEKLDGSSSTVAGSGGYEPINPNYELNYYGLNHAITGLKVNVDPKTGYAGVFGWPTGAVSVYDLRLEDCSVSGMYAGTLAGKTSGGKISNVLVTQSSGDAAGVGVFGGNGYVGGLVGETEATVVEACASAVRVTGDVEGTNSKGAGGLIGKTTVGTLTGCYSAGFTTGGAYVPSEDGYNVTAPSGVAGGLVAAVEGTPISYCYSTCSASGPAVGGLVGKSDAEISYCYAAGLVGPIGDDSFAGAFAGELSGNASNYYGNYYYSAVNWSTAGAVGIGSSGARAFDEDTKTYRMFVPSGEEGSPRSEANPYDDTLTAYYQGKYNLRTVTQLGPDEHYYAPGESERFVSTYYVYTHYGDWPAPEILIINTPE